MSAYPTSRPPRTRGSGMGVFAASSAMLLLVAVLWLLEVLDQASGGALDRFGIVPRTEEGAAGVFIAPWLHVGFAHLVSNTVPFFVLGVLVLLEGWRRWLLATLAVVVASGFFVWLFSPPNSITLGASGIVFGWLTYLVARGFFTRSGKQILVGLAVFLLYGGLLWGVLPTQVGVSWQAHLGGAIGGLLAARARRDEGRRRAPVYRGP